MKMHQNQNRLIWISALLFFACAAILHYLFIFEIHPPELHVYSDMSDYLGRAESIATDGLHSFSAFWKPKGYYLWIYLSILLSRIGLFQNKFDFLKWSHWALSLATPILMAKLVKPYLGRVGFILALVAGWFYLPFIGYSGLFMAETLFSFLVILFFFLFHKYGTRFSASQGMILALVFFLAFSVKGQVALAVPGAILFSMISSYRFKQFKQWTTFFFVFAVLMILTGLFFSGSWKLLGKQSVPSVAGINFVAAKCTQCCAISSSSGSWVLNPAASEMGCAGKETCVFQSSFEDTAFFIKAGLECLIKRPSNIFSGMGNFFNLFLGNTAWPINQDPTLLTALRISQNIFILWFFPGIFCASIYVLVRKKITRFSVLVSAFLSVSFAALFVLDTEIRFRIPFDSVFMVIGMIGGALAFKKFSNTVSVFSRLSVCILFLFLTLPWCISIITGLAHHPLVSLICVITAAMASALSLVAFAHDFARAQSTIPHS